MRPESRTQKHKRSACRRGRHDYGQHQNIGAGIVRRVCDVCGAVTIDLTHSDELTSPVLSAKETIRRLVARRT